MCRHPAAFDGLYTNMIAAGESGGILDTILKRLAACIETNVKLRRQVRSAMTYPVAVVAIAAAVVGVILWKVIPTFAVLFEGVGATLPLPTRLVIAASDSLITLLPAIVGAGLGGAAALRWFRATERGRHLGDAAMLRGTGRGCDPSRRRVGIFRWPDPHLPHLVGALRFGRPG